MRRILYAAVLFVLSALPCLAQTPYTFVGPDGNFYGASNNQFYSYSPATSTFTGLNGATGDLNLCLLRSDGTFLGTNTVGTDAYQLVKVSLTGQITPIVQFPNAYASAGCPAIASDGNYYGSSSVGGDYGFGYLYQLTPAGALNIFYNFTDNTDGFGSGTPPVEGSDGNLYYFGQNWLQRYSPTTGLTVTRLTNALGSAQEGPDGDFYAFEYGDGFQNVAKVSPAGAITVLYAPTAAAEGISQGLSNLSVLDNGLSFIVGSSYLISDQGDGCSADGNYLTLDTLSPSGTLASIYSLGTDEYNPNGEFADGDEYTYGLLLGANGTYFGFYTDYNQIDNAGPTGGCDGTTTTYGPYDLQVPSSYSSIQMKLNKTHVLPGESTTLTWDVGNAYSLTMQQCYGFGALSGEVARSGTLTANAPSTPGRYVTAIVCGGTETALATLTVGDAALSLSASSGTVLIGNSVKLTATVTNAGTPPPTGSVKFLYGTSVIGTGTLVNGVATYTASTTGLPAGTYNITASYAGDANYGPATAPAIAIELVPREPTTTTLTPATQSLKQGATATITATITGSYAFAAPSGTVTFLDGETVLTTAPLTAASTTVSTATLSESTAGIPSGTYTITASYAGDVNNLPSTSATGATVTITATTQVTLTSSANPVPANTAFTLTATPQGKDTPTGTVIFYNGTSQLASAGLSNGVAKVTVPAGTLAAGTYSLTAYYAGDSNNPAGTSAALSLTVQ